jgi:hypothetical protein
MAAKPPYFLARWRFTSSVSVGTRESLPAVLTDDASSSY